MWLFSKPETVLLKEPKEAGDYLTKLLELAGRAEMPFRERIEEEIRLIRETVLLEEEVLRRLKEWKTDSVVLSDLNFCQNGIPVHLDFYVVTPKVYFILECKPMEEPIKRADEQLELFREKKREGASRLQKVSVDTHFDSFFKSLVLSRDPIPEAAGEGIKSRAAAPEKLVSVMEHLNEASGARKLSPSEMRKSGEKLLKACDKEPFYYEQRLRALEFWIRNKNGGYGYEIFRDDL